MTRLHETAYPRLKKQLSEEELQQKYTLTQKEYATVTQHNRKPTVAQLGFSVLFKTFQWLGYFIPMAEVPISIITHIAKQHQWEPYLEKIHQYDQSSTRDYHMKLIRHYFLLSPKGQVMQKMKAVALEAAQTKENLADIINIIIEHLLKERYELPAFYRLLKVARAARATINQQCYTAIQASLNPESLVLLEEILKLPQTNEKSLWYLIKTEPKQPTQQQIKSFVQHVRWLESMALKLPLSSTLPVAKRKQFELEARALNVAKMNELKFEKRVALATILVNAQYAKALDDVATMFIRFMSKLHYDAKSDLEKFHLNHTDETDTLISTLHHVITVSQGSDSSSDEKLKAIHEALAPNPEEVLEKCNQHLAYANQNYYPFLLKRYHSKRFLFYECVSVLQLKSTSQDTAFEGALHFILKNKETRKEKIKIIEPQNSTAEKPLLDFTWMSDKWYKLVTGMSSRNKSVQEVDKKYLELAVFSQLMQELKSGDMCIIGSEAYSDYREQLISWEEYEKQIQEYESLSGISTTSETFVSDLRDKLQKLAEATDSSFPVNNTVSIVNNEIVIKKAKSNKKLNKIKKTDQLITERLPSSSILDVIVDVEKWLNLSRRFKPLFGNEPKRDTVRERFITTTFCYGCNLGPTQTERALKLFDRKQIADFNRLCMSEESIEEAITEVINTYHKLDLPSYFGDGKSASVDGTMWDIYEQNLLAEYHIRYGGYGGIGYYHVSDKYIALFSRFIPCGVYEAIYILDGLLENKSDIQPTKIHGDTQSQNTPVFGLSYLLGIDLMPRIRHLKSLTFYRPTKESKFQHIDSLFGEAINWELIQTHVADMLRVALSIKAGKISASTILRRLGTYSRKNKLYFAFRELGLAIRTLFLLKYVSDPEVRSVIQAATCKSEEFNAFVQWAMFGNQGIIADNLRTQQSKIIKYNHLVANMVILHNAVNMTRVIDQLIAEGVDITPEIISQLSPYRTEHINRFGIYLLDLEKITLPLQLDLKLLFKDASPEMKSKKKDALVSAL